MHDRVPVGGPLPFVNRSRELGRLSALLRRPGVTVACLYGRRRCGKSRLLRELLRGRRSVFYVADDLEAPLQRAGLSREISGLLPGFGSVQYPSWNELLERWFHRAPPGAARRPDRISTARDMVAALDR